MQTVRDLDCVEPCITEGNQILTSCEGIPEQLSPKAEIDAATSKISVSLNNASTQTAFIMVHKNKSTQTSFTINHANASTQTELTEQGINLNKSSVNTMTRSFSSKYEIYIRNVKNASVQTSPITEKITGKMNDCSTQTTILFTTSYKKPVPVPRSILQTASKPETPLCLMEKPKNPLTISETRTEHEREKYEKQLPQKPHPPLETIIEEQEMQMQTSGTEKILGHYSTFLIQPNKAVVDSDEHQQSAMDKNISKSHEEASCQPNTPRLGVIPKQTNQPQKSSSNGRVSQTSSRDSTSRGSSGFHIVDRDEINYMPDSSPQTNLQQTAESFPNFSSGFTDFVFCCRLSTSTPKHLDTKLQTPSKISRETKCVLLRPESSRTFTDDVLGASLGDREAIMSQDMASKEDEDASCLQGLVFSHYKDTISSNAPEVFPLKTPQYCNSSIGPFRSLRSSKSSEQSFVTAETFQSSGRRIAHHQSDYIRTVQQSDLKIASPCGDDFSLSTESVLHSGKSLDEAGTGVTNTNYGRCSKKIKLDIQEETEVKIARPSTFKVLLFLLGITALLLMNVVVLYGMWVYFCIHAYVHPYDERIWCTMPLIFRRLKEIFTPEYEYPNDIPPH